MIYQHDDISVFYNALPDSICSMFIRKFEKWKAKGKTFSGVVSTAYKASIQSNEHLVSIDIRIGEEREWADLNSELHNYFATCVAQYLSDYKHIDADTTLIHEHSCIMSEYEAKKGKFAVHQDDVAIGAYKRSLTLIAYFNHVDLGGETHFLNQDIKVKPAKGAILIFPSNFVCAHQGLTPISNSKFIAVSFCDVQIKA